MVVCSYYLRGQCRFGSNCRNEHPAQPRQTGFDNMALNNSRQPDKFTPPFTADGITNDLTAGRDKPLWPLSSYAPFKNDPLLISGLDESFEELRVKAVTAKNSGDANSYITYESQKIAAAEQTFSNARSNIDQAYDQAIKHSQVASAMVVSPVASAFGAGSSSTSSGAPASNQGSAFGSRTPAGVSAFGSGTPSAFGSGSSASGATSSSVPAFGQSTFGQPVFGQSTSSQPSTQPAFGKPSSGFSAFANSSPSAFGFTGTNASGGGGFSAFAGPSSAFGSSVPTTSTPAFGSTNTSAFGSSAPQTSTSAFGSAQPQPVFGGTAFSQPQPSQQSVFGASGSNPGSTSGGAFASSTSSHPFAPSQASASTFGSASTLGSAFAPAQPTSAFGSAPSAFTPVQSSSYQATSAFSALKSNPFSSTTQPAAAIKDPPDFFGGKRSYVAGTSPYDSQLPANYMSIIPPAALEAFKGREFEPGKIPEWIPPVELR